MAVRKIKKTSPSHLLAVRDVTRAHTRAPFSELTYDIQQDWTFMMLCCALPGKKGRNWSQFFSIVEAQTHN